MEPEPGEKELEVPAEPDHEYIDEIIRRMAQKQAAAREKAEAARPQPAAVVSQPAASLARPRRAWSLGTGSGPARAQLCVPVHYAAQ